jgi:TPP-dependent pyruvate/acetoin dehydrogenase alpha subunit
MEGATQAPDSPPSDVSRTVLVELFKKMSLIKLCDERFRQAMRAGRIIAPYYPPRGQEAIAAAVGANLNRDDYLITIYRGLHDQLAKGMPLKELWAEYAGRVDGACKGKGGPMHITHPESGIMVTTGIVGSGIPIANGFGWASQLNGDQRVTVTNFGDGATNIGAFHEAMNLASLWKLPVIFMCQNNGYAEHTRLDHGTAGADIAKRASAYDMPGVRVDGNDPVAVYRTVKDAVSRARAGEGPTLVEAVTFRFLGHNFGDPGDYIPPEEMTAALARDPMVTFRRDLLAWQVVSEKELSEIESTITAEIEEAFEFALASPHPSIDELSRDVYKQEVAA